MKLDIFDSSVSLHEYLAQFQLIAHANDWDVTAKAVNLAACLRGKARAIFERLSESDMMNYEKLRSELEFCFGKGRLEQTYYLQFANRRQKASGKISLH